MEISVQLLYIMDTAVRSRDRAAQTGEMTQIQLRTEQFYTVKKVKVAYVRKELIYT